MFESILVWTVAFDYLVGGQPIGLAQLLDDNRLLTDFGSDSVVFEVVSKFVQVLVLVVVRVGFLVVLGSGVGFAVVKLIGVAGGFGLVADFSRLLIRSCVAFGK